MAKCEYCHRCGSSKNEETMATSAYVIVSQFPDSKPGPPEHNHNTPLARDFRSDYFYNKASKLHLSEKVI
jgi:hypothetical protein